jgi:hypothetical protein
MLWKEAGRRMVLPVLRALQGHLKSGPLWEKHVFRILAKPKLGFKPATHERNICIATVKGISVLLLCQVNDFVLACPHTKLAEYIYPQVGMSLQLSIEKDIPFEYCSLAIKNSTVFVLLI